MPTTYLEAGGALPYCRGCSHGVVLRALGQALKQLQIPPHELAIVTDIGCVGLADAQFVTPHTVHTTHGRSTAFAAGLGLADSVLGAGRLKPVVMIGDGGAMIGLNHLVNAALLNPDVTVLVHNNFLFGMTGGQNSAFTPVDFVTSTTLAGNATPPLDLAQVLLASRAPFVARKLATDRDLADVIARAIAHPGFALVEVLELCTAYATRWNTLTGAQLAAVAQRAGYEMGILRDEPRPTFAAIYRGQAPRVKTKPERGVATVNFPVRLERPLSVILAGTAGERVQTAALLLGQAALRAGLQVTLKNDNPVTQGTGFSVSEVILNGEEIVYTGIEQPDAIIVVSNDGVSELERNGTFDRVTAETLVLADAEITLPALAGHVLRAPFRETAGANFAALAGVARWLERTRVLPLEAFWAAIQARFGEKGPATIARLKARPSTS